MLIEKDGWSYYTELPEGYRTATVDDFVKNGRLRIGLRFLIQWVSQDIFQVCIVSETLTSKFIKPFIAEGRVFIKSENHVKS